jgi:hypothetical protein
MKPLEVVGFFAILAIAGTLGWLFPQMIYAGAWYFIWGDNMPESIYRSMEALQYFRYVCAALGLVFGYILSRTLQHLG